MNILLAGCLVLLTVIPSCQRSHFATHAEQSRTQQVPKAFSYPESPEIVEDESSYEANLLAGRITDPTGAGLKKALVERLTESWEKRIDATFADPDGSFLFS